MNYEKPKFSVFVGETDMYALGHARTFGPKCSICGEAAVDHEPEGFVAYYGHGLLSCEEIRDRKAAGENLENHPPDTSCTDPDCDSCAEE